MRTRSMRAGARALILLAALTAACSGDSDTASKAAEPAVPETPESVLEKAAALRRGGDPKAALDTALKAYTMAREGPRVDIRIEMAKAHGAAGNSAAAINEIKVLEREKRDENVAVDEVAIAEVYAQIGDPNAVQRWLQRAIEAKSPKLQGLEANPDLEPFKSDPRWQMLLSSITK